MKHNIIKTDNYLLVADDSEIKEGDYRMNIQRGYVKLVDDAPEYYNQRNDVFKKVIAHLPLNNSPILEGVDLLPPLEDNVIGKPMYDYVNEKHNQDRCMGFIDGYNKAKEKYKYTEEDMRKAFLSGVGITGEGYNAEYSDDNDPDIETEFGEQADKFIQSLSQPKMPTHFECEMKFKQMPDFHKDEPKTTTNSQGQTEWVGNYIY